MDELCLVSCCVDAALLAMFLDLVMLCIHIGLLVAIREMEVVELG